MAEIASEASSSTGCFHCALPIPSGSRFTATIGGSARAMCCPGCVAVAELIAASGLEAYYRFRERPADTPAAPTPERAAELARYDHPSLQRTFVRHAADDLLRCTLSLEGVRCGACVWLIEGHCGAAPVSATSRSTRRAPGPRSPGIRRRRGSACSSPSSHGSATKPVPTAPTGTRRPAARSIARRSGASVSRGSGPCR